MPALMTEFVVWLDGDQRTDSADRILIARDNTGKTRVIVRQYDERMLTPQQWRDLNGEVEVGLTAFEEPRDDD